VLHVINGESTAQTLKQSGVVGEHLVWKEALIWGPTPGNLSATEWCRVRADFLAGANGMDAQQCFEDLMQQEAMLGRLANHDEVVLWFEFDLFCQLNLIYLLGKLRGQDFTGTTLSLVCIGEFPGIQDFRGLGQLTPEQLVSLFPERRLVTPEQLELAQRAWNVCSGSNPRAIELLLREDTTPLPFLQSALRLHLRRFPSVKNGLGHMEQMAVDCIARGVGRFPEIFREWSAAEPGYGLGDTQLWDVVTRLVECGQPLLLFDGNGGFGFEENHPHLKQPTFTLTETGRAILEGKRDLWEMEPREFWLGGVRLAPPKPCWRWDEERQALAG